MQFPDHCDLVADDHRQRDVFEARAAETHSRTYAAPAGQVVISSILPQVAARQKASQVLGSSRAPQVIGLVRPSTARAYAVSFAPAPTSARSDLRSSDQNGYCAQTPNANPDRIRDAASGPERLGVLTRHMDIQVSVRVAHRHSKTCRKPAHHREHRACPTASWSVPL